MMSHESHLNEQNNGSNNMAISQRYIIPSIKKGTLPTESVPLIVYKSMNLLSAYMAEISTIL